MTLNDFYKCSVHADCVNIPGSYKCECHEGYNGDGFTCRMILPDHAECSYVGDICEEVHCVEGYEPGPNFMVFSSPTYMEDSCIDIDECDPANIKHLCHKYAECTNTDGGYYCECKYGWTGDGYKDCTVILNENGKCLNDICDEVACKVGFRGDGHHCWDINECDEGTHNCVHNAFCYDTDGSWECECETNWLLRTNDTECRPDVCPDGYYGQGMYCKQMPDNAECKDDRCEDYICKVGYADDRSTATNSAKFSGTEGNVCEDIDECIIGKEYHDRAATSYASGTPPDYKCVSEDSACKNTIGSYECSCLVGYIGDPESDVKCNVNGCPLDHGCIPEPCDLGYYGSKSHGCYKMPEHGTCKGKVVRGLNYQCGAFQCNIGFDIIRPRSKTKHKEHEKWYIEKKDASVTDLAAEEFDCEDIDECTVTSGKCGDPIRVGCYNTIGSYYCLCQPGYRVQANWQKADDLFTVNIAHGYNYLESTKQKFTIDDDYHCAKSRCPDGKWGRGLDCFDMPHEAAYCSDEACSSFNCRTGWFRDGYTCIDLDECDNNCERIGWCKFNYKKTACKLEKEICINSPGSYKCECKEHFERTDRWNPNSDCIEAMCPAGQFGKGENCMQLHEQARCADLRCETFTCLAGYLVKGSTCVDTNECEHTSHLCSDNAICMDTEGTYFCTCKEGYSGWAYDKSSSGGCQKNKCSAVQYGDGVNCFLIPKHGVCDGKGCLDFKCVDGYQKSGPNCENINECADGSHDCDSAEKARCEDVHPIPGVKGWLCHCQYPYEGNGRNCKMAKCPSGQAGQGGQCIPLPAHAVCSPSKDNCLYFKCEDGYSSGVRNTKIKTNRLKGKGYYVSGRSDTRRTDDLSHGRECNDIDECGLNVHDCSFNSKCINTMGSYWCHCPDYFSGTADETDLPTIGIKIAKRNRNLANCRLENECGGAGFGQTVHLTKTATNDKHKGCLTLPPNAQFVRGSDKKLGYECVQGYELQSDGSCDDINECDWKIKKIWDECKKMVPKCSPGLQSTPCENYDGGFHCQIQKCLSRSPPTAMWHNFFSTRASFYNKQADAAVKSKFKAKCTRPGGCKMY